MIARIRFAAVLIILGLVTILLIPLQYLLLKLKLPLAKKVPLYWHRFALKLVGMRVRVVGDVPSDGPMMLVSNHISWTDIPVLGSIMELCFIAKQEIDEMPGANLLARMQRTVFVKREAKRAVGQQVSEITERLLNGDTMVLFGEGSTGNGSIVSPFKSSLLGAAQYAIAHTDLERVMIQPVAIAYTGLQGIPLGRYTRCKSAWYGDLALGPHAFYIMMKSSWDVEVTFGEPIEFTEDSKRQLIAEAARVQVRAMFVKSVNKRGDEVLALP